MLAVESNGVILTGGCRAQPGGVHWGHAYGSFSGVQMSAQDRFVFVISDTVGTPRSCDSYAFEIAQQILSWPLDGWMAVCRESRIRPSLARLALEIERTIGLSRLQKYHPHRREIRGSGRYRGSIGDLIFPLHQASYLIGIGTNIACYNDDNSFVVAFTREVARRLRKDSAWEEPKLSPRDPGHLIGRDGRRMCKGNRNALSLHADAPSVRRYVGSLVGRGVGDGDPSEQVASKQELGLAQLLMLDAKELDGDAQSRTVALTEAMNIMRARLVENQRNLNAKTVAAFLARDEAWINGAIESNCDLILDWFR